MPGITEAKHFYNRFGFGLTFDQFQFYSKKAFEREYTLKRELAKSKPKKIRVDHPLENMAQMMEISQDEKKELIKADRKRIIELNRLWIDEMTKSDNQVAEKMALFWHDHFACKPKTARMAEEQINLIRSESTGSFRKLLHGIAKNPAMLLYLNNQQNRKRKPNENFARELMELFTLGLGKYSEKDIKESARAFTGWGIDKNGDYILRTRQHDYGRKTFFGKTGNWNGEDIIDMILEREETAEFVSAKVSRFLIGPKFSQADIKGISKEFYDSDYDISRLLQAIECSPSFYDQRNFGNDVLSPVELIVKIKRNFGVDFHNENASLIIQKALGQVLLQPPNVAGWPEGKSWIDTSTIQTRMQIGRAVLLHQELKHREDESFAMGEDLTEGIAKRDKNKFKANLKLEGANDFWKSTTYSEIIDQASTWLLCNENNELLMLMTKHPSPHHQPLPFALALLTATPEYQLK